MTKTPSSPLVSIVTPSYNQAHFLEETIQSVLGQTYPNLEVIILDNASDDTTPEIVASEYPEFRLVRSDTNLGMWPGQELLLTQSRGVYILSLSVDVLIDPTFIEQAVAVCEGDSSIDAVQSKTYQYEIHPREQRGNAALTRERIDTCGFGMTRGRKVYNIGHGCTDGPEYAHTRTIFGVEGAAPFFRRGALEDCRVSGQLIDPDYFWYGDDLDLAWRMTLFGHRQVFAPTVVAWHDRSTTKGAADSLAGHLGRLSARRSIPLKKRRLDWSNVRFTIIKNDYIINL